jgi:hypothetical protein
MARSPNADPGLGGEPRHRGQQRAERPAPYEGMLVSAWLRSRARARPCRFAGSCRPAGAGRPQAEEREGGEGDHCEQVGLVAGREVRAEDRARDCCAKRSAEVGDAARQPRYRMNSLAIWLLWATHQPLGGRADPSRGVNRQQPRVSWCRGEPRKVMTTRECAHRPPSVVARERDSRRRQTATNHRRRALEGNESHRWRTARPC